ncbi:G-protein coupled receptor 12 [Takifugu flavidus]|uniref:G-protein coupled receptor 12 n=1 Tax=Takifugu flavidus TaxID=433684 RepID=A0A5C6NDF2_9TELE|nr:G-protein coupled receptor 12 [Takifugu flavidus]
MEGGTNDPHPWLAAAAALPGGGGLNSSYPLDPLDPSRSWSLDEDPSNSSSEPATRSLLPEAPRRRARRRRPQALSPWDVALCVTGTLVSCENALVIAVLFYTPTLRAPMFVLIGSLALADLLAGLGLILNFVLVYLVDPSAQLLSLLSAGLLIAAFSASVLNVLAITVDRYLSLYNALTYHTERTVTCTYLMNNAVALAVAFLLVFALMMQLYLQICKIAFRHAQQIAVQHQFLATSTTKGVSTLSAILCAFGACWLPFAMYSIVADSSYPIIYTYATVLPATCCSVINPIIYAFRNPDIQKSLWMACCGCVPPNLSLRPRASSDV